MARNSKILIVNDEPCLCDSLKTILSTQNYDVRTCRTDKDAVSLLTKDPLDLVILDIDMERMDGFQVLQAIINQEMDTPVIIITGNASIESAVKALKMGANDYFKKPIKPEELFQSVGDIITQKTLRKKLKESNKRYETLVNIIPIGIQITDMDGKIIFSNRAHHKIQGSPDGQLIGKFLWELIAEEADRLKTKEYYRFLIREQPEPELYFSIDRTKDGRLIYTQINWDYIRDSRGKLIGIISAISDITEQKKAETGRDMLLKELQEALENVKTLNGLLPICAQCKKIRDDEGYWNQIEGYIQKYSHATFTHSMCPECSETLYGKEGWYIKAKNKRLRTRH